MKQKIISFGARPRTAKDPRTQNSARRKRRRTGRQTLNYLLLFIVVLAIMTALSLTVFFNIETITVKGTTKYAPEDIIETSAVKIGDNLFRLDENGIRKRLKEEYSYVEDVRFERALPAGLGIVIVQAKPLGAIDTGDGYVILGKEGRILETGARSISEDVLVVNGMYIAEPEVGHIMGEGFSKEQEEEQKKEITSFNRLKYLIAALEETQFTDFTMIDFSDDLNMRIVYQNRVMIEVGSVADLPYKLRFADYLLNREIPNSFEGVLDVSIAATTKNAYTRPGDVGTQLAERKLDSGEPQGDKLQAATPSFEEYLASKQPQSQKKEEAKTAVDPELETIPGTERVQAAASGSSAQPASSDEAKQSGQTPETQSKAASSSMQELETEASASSQVPADGVYLPDELEVIPGTEIVKNDTEEKENQDG